MRAVYALVHNPTGKVYIGSSERPAVRVNRHLTLLKNGNHKNEAMQNDCNKYGFDYTPYVIDVIPTDIQSYREYMWMAYFQSYDPEKGYNNKDPRAKALSARNFPKVDMSMVEPIPHTITGCVETLGRFWNIPLSEIWALEEKKVKRHRTNENINSEDFEDIEDEDVGDAKNSIYARVKTACEESGKTVSELENDLGFARSSIYKWDEHTPSVDKVLMVAKELNQPMEYFLSEGEEENAKVTTG